MTIDKVKFLRAKADPSEPDYDPASDDDEFVVLGTLDVGMRTAGGRARAATCPAMWAILTSEQGYRYAYALCGTCFGATQDEAHQGTENTDVRGEVIPGPVPDAGHGPIHDKVNAAHDAFVAAGEPEPVRGGAGSGTVATWK